MTIIKLPDQLSWQPPYVFPSGMVEQAVLFGALSEPGDIESHGQPAALLWTSEPEPEPQVGLGNGCGGDKILNL
jgi:hypothetical protein